MKNTKIGKIDTTELNVPPEKHEYETAKYFANRGHNVKFIKPHYIQGLNNPDFEICGKAWETKSPTRFSNSTFEFNFKKAVKQFPHIILIYVDYLLMTRNFILKILKNVLWFQKQKIL